ncbi:TAXI family TRAP transporter solute-binding subunit [Paracoccus aerodenitrificans]|uniref:TAXI family TRAP transporter solute-binding subunit n=1 Tax=Paracoccus aerodenitrificans TaxID=3017781 RepID=UPI0022F1007E|nr:TAXI family TRAP transporter solute-binding subunit [Paracoccus aerodenitrificans]WBU63560.1 TAXI family TRAP transporter solute-binding subunit [Paracoccus aerodenitrificans]
MKFSYLAAASIFAVIGAQQPAQAELNNITIGTNPSGSSFFVIGSGFAKLFQETLGIRSTAQPFAGSSVYLPAIEVGDMTLGLASTVDSSLAYTGSSDYPQELTRLRAIASVWNIPYAFITQANSGIITADDLAGKRIMGDMPASQALTEINKAIVQSGGLGLEEVDFMSSGGLMDGISAVVEGRADAAPVATSMPVLLESQASVSGGLRIVANGSQGSDEFFRTAVVGVGGNVAKEDPQRPFIIGDTDIVSYDTLLVASSEMSEEDAYLLAKTLYENWGKLQESMGQLRSIDQNEIALSSSSIPYHPGAIRFYKEVGVWTDAHEENQSKF